MEELEILTNVEKYVEECIFFGDEPDLEDLAKILWSDEWQRKLES